MWWLRWYGVGLGMDGPTGPGALNEKTGARTPPELKAGDRILFGKWSGQEVKVDGVDLLIMKESDVLGTLS